MKSRTLSSDRTAFRKLFGRFSPLWVWYSVFLLLVYILNLTNSSYPDFDEFYEDFVIFSSFFNAIYGCMSAMALFGYLCDSRECNAVHTWPIRRESHFLGRILAGFLFHLIPNTLFFLCGLPFTYTLSLAIRWLILMELQFICFFGLAVLCMLLSGRKLAGAALFILINSLALLLMWVVSTMYQPLLYGVELNQEAFMKFSPFYQLIATELRIPQWPMGPMDASVVNHFIYAAVGLAAMGLAMILYRRRQLETAGDFIVFGWLKPPFILAMTISMGSFMAVFMELFLGNEDLILMIFLALGLLTGYFASMMLLRRSPRVFSLRNWLQAAAILICIFLSLWITKLDPLGRVEYVPRPEQIASVNIRHYEVNTGYTATTEAEKSDIAALHQSILDTGIRDSRDIYYQPDYDNSTDNVYFEYRLKTGQVIRRSYLIYRDEQENWANYYHSQPEVIFYDMKSLDELKEETLRINMSFCGIPLLDVEDNEGLLEAIWRDCEEGHMSMNTYYPTYEAHIHLSGQQYVYLNIPSSAFHTLNYIEAHLLDDDIRAKMQEEWITNWKGYEEIPIGIPVG